MAMGKLPERMLVFADSQVLTTTMTNRYLETIGFPNIVKRYEEMRERAKRLEKLHGIC